MLIEVFATVALLAAASGDNAMEIYGWNHEIVSPPDAASGKKLESALQRFERDLAGRRRGGAAASSKPKEIVVVGSKIRTSRAAPAPSLGDIVGPPCRPRPKTAKPGSGRTIIGGFKSLAGMDSETEVVEFRQGQETSSLGPLQTALREFEGRMGPANSCVRTCRAAGNKCLADCRRLLSANRATGRCVCEHVRARCLVNAAKRGRCARKGR